MTVVRENNLIIALAGNPNVGKSTLFNALTGEQQHVGNWPGKTIEKKEGTARLKDRSLTLVDLPGTYSLNAYSIEEVIARDFIVRECPALVVIVADAANLERNLYLLVQVLELEAPALLVLNMVDAAHKRGVRIDSVRLAERLGVPVLETVGSRGVGLDALRDALFNFAVHPAASRAARIDYGPDLEAEIAALQVEIERDELLCQSYHPRWLALKLLENDDDLRTRLQDLGRHALLARAQEAAERVAAESEDDAETLITDRRYQFIADVVRGTVVRSSVAGETRSDRADRVLTHPVWGVLIFLLLMWVLFQFTANVSAPFLDWIDGVIAGPVTRWAQAVLDGIGLSGSWVEGLVVDGVIAGVGGVLVFVPVLFFLYLGVALLEDSGYMARSAFVMDRLMRAIGLHGKSFLPLMVGFGCTVPAIYATRTLDDENDRRLTAFLTPFMSCGARLPVYVVFGAAFFGEKSGTLIFAMYLLGVALALLTGLLLKATVYRHKTPPPFMLELPPYHMPNLRSVSRQVRQRIGDFLRNATTIILACTIVIWFLLALPAGGQGKFNAVDTRSSVFGSLSRVAAPLFAPAGFGSWQAAGSLITGFVAKEAVVGTMNLIYVEESDPSTGEDDASQTPTLRDDVREITATFGDAVILTAQETANILPRTANVVPGVHLAEWSWLDQGSADPNTTKLEAALTTGFTATAGSPERGQLGAVAFNVFVLLYIPCMATVAAMRHEFGTRWMFYQIVYTLALAWTAAVIVFQVGLLIGIG